MAKLWLVDKLTQRDSLISRGEKSMLPIDACMLLFEHVVESFGMIWSNRGNLPKAFARKLAALTIHEAQFDERARFARAAARISLIDEATLVVHIIVKIMPRAGEQLSKVAGRKIHEFCPHLTLDPKNLSQDVDQPLSSIQTQQHARSTANFRLLDQDG